MSIALKFRLGRASRLVGDEGGMALIEFALTLPLLAALGIGGLELANYALANLRVNQIALAVADNAGRVMTSIDETDVTEVFLGAEITGEPIDFKQNGRIVLSSLEPNGLTGTNKGQMINWQRCWGDLRGTSNSRYGVQGRGRTNGTLQRMGATGRTIAAIPGTAIMFVEVTYRYSPLVGNLMAPPTMRYESAFIVRGRLDNNITNSGSNPVNNCTLI